VALVDQRAGELGHAPVALMEHFGVVVVALARVLEHVL
jgi:hypothetical protein